MKNLLIFCLFLSISLACKTEPYKVSTYFNTSEKDTLLTNIITYIYKKPLSATNSTRFEAKFRKYYVENLPKFSLEKLYQSPDSITYFFVIRPAGNTLKYQRGVLGKFNLKTGSLMPIDFEEIANTPPLEEKELKERGNFLFQELVKNKNLNNYLVLKHYIEWPDSSLIYDKKSNEWVSKQKF